MQLKMNKNANSFTMIGSKQKKSLVGRILRRIRNSGKKSKSKEIERLHYEMDKQSRLIAQLNRQINDLQSDRRIANKELYKMAAPKKVKTVKAFHSQYNVHIPKYTKELNSSLSVLL